MNKTLGPANALSIDTYRFDITPKMKKQSTCQICMQQHANKTQKEQHRRAVHPRNLGQEISDDEFKVDPLALYDVVGDEALQILGKRNELYLVKFDGYTEWMYLSPECCLVTDYEEDCQRDGINVNEQLPIITKEMMKDWMSNELPGEIVVEEDMLI